MPINEKELNCTLLDKIDMLERLERVAKKERRQIERKLYQQPPLFQET